MAKAVHCVMCGERTQADGPSVRCDACGAAFTYAATPSMPTTTLSYATPQTDPHDERPPLNKWCAWALIFSLGAIVFPVFGVTAIVLAIIGLTHIRRPDERGTGQATAAIVIGVLGSLASIVIWLTVPRALSSARYVACQSNLRQLAQGIYQYENDFPDARGYTYEDVAAHAGFGPGVTTCPNFQHRRSSATRPPSYVFLTHLQPYRNLKESADTVIAFELGTHEIRSTNSYGINVLFGDGHTEFMDVLDAAVAIERSMAGGDGSTTRPAQ